MLEAQVADIDAFVCSTASSLRVRLASLQTAIQQHRTHVTTHISAAAAATAAGTAGVAEQEQEQGAPGEAGGSGGGDGTPGAERDSAAAGAGAPGNAMARAVMLQKERWVAWQLRHVGVGSPAHAPGAPGMCPLSPFPASWHMPAQAQVSHGCVHKHTPCPCSCSWAQPPRVAWFHAPHACAPCPPCRCDLVARARAMGQEYLELEGFVNLNYAALTKVLQAHDRLLPDAPCWAFYRVRGGSACNTLETRTLDPDALSSDTGGGGVMACLCACACERALGQGSCGSGVHVMEGGFV